MYFQKEVFPSILLEQWNSIASYIIGSTVTRGFQIHNFHENWTKIDLVMPFLVKIFENHVFFLEKSELNARQNQAATIHSAILSI